MYLVFIAILIVLIVIFCKIRSKLKFPKITCLAVFTGEPKVGKSGVSLACALSQYRSVHRAWRFNCFFRKLFRKPLLEEPLLYSNIPLAGVKYCELTLQHILREVRFNFKSVIFIDEASLLCDCYLSKTDMNLSTELLKFFKLIGHETHSGYAIFNSQALSDLHIALRKCTSQYFFIHSTSSRYFPFVSYCRMREERYSEDGACVNNYNSDIEDTMKFCLFRKKTFKMYDSHSYSVLTDHLKTNNIEKFNKFGVSLKAKNIISFRKEFAEMFDKELKGVDDNA